MVGAGEGTALGDGEVPGETVEPRLGAIDHTSHTVNKARGPGEHQSCRVAKRAQADRRRDDAQGR